VARFRARGGDAADEWESLLSLVACLRAACARSEIDESLDKRVDHTEERAVGTRVLAAARDRQQPATQVETVDNARTSDSMTVNLDAIGQVLRDNWQIRESESVSKVPAIAALRDVWNSVAIRPYVLPMMQQQARYNQVATELLTAVSRVQMELKARQMELKAGQMELEVKQNEIAVTQVEILHLVRELLDRVTCNECDIAQSIRELNTLADALARLQSSPNADPV
jgi:hypothetical protein